jgi:hypothetical protein
MSKKKNTLKDLDEFLKQQAATLVSPEKLSQKVEEPEITVSTQQPVPEQQISTEKILSDLKMLAKKEGPAFKKNLYDLIIKSLEDQPHASAEDKMLINTALYLKSGDNWKDAIRTYWKNRP